MINNYTDNYYNITKERNISHWEFQILSAIRRESKTESKISKHVKLNASIVSEIITTLIEKGFVIGTRKRRMLFFYAKYFSTTLDGLMAIEQIRETQDRNSNTFWRQIVSMMSGYKDYL